MMAREEFFQAGGPVGRVSDCDAFLFIGVLHFRKDFGHFKAGHQALVGGYFRVRVLTRPLKDDCLRHISEAILFIGMNE